MNELYTCYIATNHMGTVKELFSPEGDLVWKNKNSLWGKPDGQLENRNLSPDVECSLGFQGQYFDKDSGLHYNFHRYYDAEMGQYISPDPIGLLGGLHPMAYVHNPNGWVDPWGLAGHPTDISFAGSSDLFPVTGNQRNIVEITLTGDRSSDFTRAFKDAGIKRNAASGYTWHHVHDFDPVTGKATMELVTTSAHEATIPHKGSAGQFSDHFGVKYDTYEAKMKAHEQGWRKKPKKIKFSK